MISMAIFYSFLYVDPRPGVRPPSEISLAKGAKEASWDHGDGTTVVPTNRAVPAVAIFIKSSMKSKNSDFPFL
jgi:hypothetical protein